ncbi:MAG: nucleotidyl transferase AbiEii/AbiGii toxin family protein [Deltaproteobacteria bacterium]|nr:nucleotidyl transferase AbiEii/AbiGii toxin family protein [Deltaproteobacteria bacterium]
MQNLVSADFEEIFKILNEFGIKYLVVGAFAVINYTEPRYTKDLDILILPDINDHQRVYQALKKFGAPLQGINPEDFKNPELVYQIGVEPFRIDILTQIDGVKLPEVWDRKSEALYGDTLIHVLSFEDIVSAKRASARPKDLLDIDTLYYHQKIRSKKK